jgi:hypothetical protein
MKLNLNFIIGILVIFGILIYFNRKNEITETFSNGLNAGLAQQILKAKLPYLNQNISNFAESFPTNTSTEKEFQDKIDSFNEIISGSFFNTSYNVETALNRQSLIKQTFDRIIHTNYSNNQLDSGIIIQLVITIGQVIDKLVDLINESNTLLTEAQLNSNISDTFKENELTVFYQNVKDIAEYLTEKNTQFQTASKLDELASNPFPDTDDILEDLEESFTQEPAKSPDDGSVTSGSPGDGSVTSGSPDDGTVTSGSPGDGTVTSGSPGDGSITSGSPDDGTETSGSPGDGTVTSGSPGDGTVTSTSGSSNETNANMINEQRLIDELLNILKALNKNDLKANEKKIIGKALENIENIIVNAKINQFSDNDKFNLIMKLLSENKNLLNKNGEAVELEAIKSTFGTGGGASSRGTGNYADRPQLPSISQFKPTGTSNIFSPVIEVKSSPFRNNNNKRYSNAYEKGFENGIQRAQSTLGETNIIDQSTQITDTTVEQNITTKDTSIDLDKSIDINGKDKAGYSDSENENAADNKATPVDNGYIKGDNGKMIQKPGYSYVNPELWTIPRKRTPVCFSSGDMERKENSLDPAGFVFGGPSNVMEFHGVGSIMPKFAYNEEVKEVESRGDI